MTHHAKALPVKWAGKPLLSTAASPAATAAALGGRAAIAFGVALRYLALKRNKAPRASRPAPQRPVLRVVT